MTFAQVSTPSEGLSNGYFSPLVFAAVLYVILYVAARVLEGRDNPRFERLEDFGFLLMLLSGVYVAILAVVAIASESDLVWDMVRIVVLIAVFFGALILFLLAVFEWGIGGLSRLRHGRQSSDTGSSTK